MPETSRFRLVLPGPALSLTVAADGSTIVAGDRNGNLTVSDGEGALLWQRKLGEGIHGVAVSRDGQRIVCGSKDCQLRMFTRAGELEWEQPLGKSVWSLAMDPGGNFLATGTGDSVAFYTDGGILVWEYETARAMVGVSVSRAGSRIIACGDEQLFCLDGEGALLWQKKRGDSLWDAAISEDGGRVFLGGWDRKVHCLDGSGEERWEYLTDGYVRAVCPTADGGVLAASHDGCIYRLSPAGDALAVRRPGGELTSVGCSASLALAVAGTGTDVVAYQMDITDTVAPAATPAPAAEPEEDNLFGFGMFGDIEPDTSGLGNYEPGTTTPPVTGTAGEGGEFREFAAEMVKEDVRNYLRLGNVAWRGGRFARAAEHYERATQVAPDEPRGWHNLAVCRYYLARKSNPDDIEGAVRQAYEPLRSANRSDTQYGPALATLEYFAELLKLLEDIE